MLYRGIRSATGRTPRTIAEDKGTLPAGFTGALEYSPETGTTLGGGQPAAQLYRDPVAEVRPSTFLPRGGSEKKSW